MSTRATFTQKRETTRAAERQDLKNHIPASFGSPATLALPR